MIDSSFRSYLLGHYFCGGAMWVTSLYASSGRSDCQHHTCARCRCPTYMAYFAQAVANSFDESSINTKPRIHSAKNCITTINTSAGKYWCGNTPLCEMS